MAGIRSVDAANRYLRDVYVPQHNATFRRAPADAATAFVPVGGAEFHTILCQQDERVIAPDNTIVIGGRILQIERQPGRRTCAGLRVVVRQHLDGSITITRPPDVRVKYAVVTSDTIGPVPPPTATTRPRRRRKTGLGRWPKPEVQFASLFPKRTDHVSNS